MRKIQLNIYVSDLVECYICDGTASCETPKVDADTKESFTIKNTHAGIYYGVGCMLIFRKWDQALDGPKSSNSSDWVVQLRTLTKVPVSQALQKRNIQVFDDTKGYQYVICFANLCNWDVPEKDITNI